VITPTQYNALVVISRGTFQKGVNAKGLAWKLWGDNPAYEYLFSASSNQGNGACAGKKAWLCAGSMAGRLRKAGYIQNDRNYTGYFLTAKGEEAIREYEKNQQPIQKTTHHV